MRKILSLLLATLFSSFVIANNVIISNVTVNGSNITFTLSWENSWNTTNNTDPNYPNNWDAVWIFIKYQDAGNLWKHAVLSATSANHTVTGAGGVLQVNAVTDGMGVFVRRSSPGGGNIINATVTLAMTGLPSGTLNFKVFGIEMVHCPTGEFWLGDGNSSSIGNYFTQTYIDQDKQTTGFTFVGALYPNSPVIPNTFPMGYYGFYIMKYEASHQQYADFLNTLTYDQQARRTNFAPNSVAGTSVLITVGSNTTQTIEIITPGQNNTVPAIYGCDYYNDNIFNSSNDGQNIALEGTSKADMLAYLDWSGLRPMTEMEYEKACRGTRPAVLNEYAWGTTILNCYRRTGVPRFLINQGQINEAPNNSTGIDGSCFCLFGTIGIYGTARNGVFATYSTGRSSSGAGYYGAMELSGNSEELCIHAQIGGITFNGNHGNGSLSSSNEADVTGWPNGLDGSPISGISRRGGMWFSPSLPLKVSHREVDAIYYNRDIGRGIRGVRTYY